VDVEEVGNQVKRLAPKSVAATLRKQGYANVRWRGTLMYYPHQARRLFRWFDQSAAFFSYRIFFVATNSVLGRCGNKLPWPQSATIDQSFPGLVSRSWRLNP
jgi:hypothetical protein